MAVAVLLLLVGAAGLALGAEAAVRGAAQWARGRGVSPFVLGAVLFGVDLESLGAALVAAGRGQPSIAAGEAFGTVVFLFSAALGLALLLAPEPVRSPGPGMVLWPAGALVAGALALADQVVDRSEGLALLAVYVLYLGYVARERRPAEARGREIERDAAEGARLPPWVLTVGGLGLLYLGASAMVGGAVRLLARTSLAAGFVGAALLGGLASLDEVLLEVLPVRRGVPELAVGNLFGTLAAFTTAVLGLAALVRPLEVDAAATSAYLAAAVLYTVVAVAFLWRGRAGKGVGLVVLAVYAAWLALASTI